MATLDNRLTLTPKPKFAVCTISNSKLLSHTYNVNIMAVTYKNTRLGRSNKNSAVFAIIDKYSCAGIEYVNLTLLTIWNLELLHMQCAWLFYFCLEPTILIYEIFTLKFLFIFCEHGIIFLYILCYFFFDYIC